MKKILCILLILFDTTTAKCQHRCNYFGADFYDDVKFDGVQFDSLADFLATEFYGFADFDSAHFKNKADFTNSRFHQKAKFQESKFDSIATFDMAGFDSSVYFFDAKFYNRVSFDDSYFRLDANFDFVDFTKETRFCGATFHNESDFGNTDFGRKVDFSFTQFDGKVDFRSSSFDSVAIFNGVVFNSQCNFNFSKFPKILDLSNLEINIDALDFSEVITNGECWINLAGTDIGKLNIRYEQFKLWFSDDLQIQKAVYPKSTTATNIPFDVKANVFESLLKRTEQLGYRKSYEKLDKEYKQLIYLKGGNYGKFEGRFLNWINKNWWGYGYNKELIIRNTLLLFLFFVVINVFIINYLSSKIYVIEKLNSINKVGINKFYFLIIYTGLIFFGVKISLQNLNLSEIKTSRVFGYIYFFIMYMSGLICLAYCANYIISS